MEKKFTQNWVKDEWADPEYLKIKEKNFKILDEYLKVKPKNLLDIGCGLAWESRMFSQKYGTELYLMDGDASANKNKTVAQDVAYNASADNFLFYNTFKNLKKQLSLLGTKNYHLIDCNDISIPKNIKFDLITSWLSCGFHYPISTYASLIRKHAHKETKIIMDLRKIYFKTEKITEEGFKIINVINKNKSVKSITAEIAFLE